MSPFRFRLESVRRLRDHAERHAREALARELLAREEAVADVERIRELLHSARASVRGAGAVDASTLTAWQAYVERRDRERRSAEDALEARERLVSLRRSELEQASRDRDVLARLEARRRLEHRGAELRAEQELLGELAIAAHRRTEQLAS
jgi:flagellar export protein FliJ